MTTAIQRLAQAAAALGASVPKLLKGRLPAAKTAPKASWRDGNLQRWVAAMAGGEAEARHTPAIAPFWKSKRPRRDSAGGRANARATASTKSRATEKAQASSKAKAVRKRRRAAPPHGRFEALGWFLTAAVILAWPRRRPLIDRAKLSPKAVLGSLFAAVKSARDGSPKSIEAEVMAAEAREPGRGRAARDPFHIPLRGWQDIFWRTLREFAADNIPQVAGGVAFFGLLSIFPAMGAFVSLYGLFSNVQMAEQQLQLLAGILPDAALQMVGEQMLRLASTRHSGLGVAFVLSLLVSLWSANAGIKALFAGLNIAFEETEKRDFLRLNLASLSFTVGALVFLTLAFAAMVAAPIALAYLGYTPGGFAVMDILRWPLLLLVAVVGITLLYRYGPSREHESWPWVSWGSVFAAVLWLAVSLLFSVYVAHFGSYDRTYGSLGAAVGFMSWLWISSIAILFGAELNSEIEHQTAYDTTSGHPAPMGLRGAHMADTLGEIRPGKAKSGADGGVREKASAPISSVRPVSPRARNASRGSRPQP